MSNWIAAAIAILGLCIAFGQWTTARHKLILDLYDRRRAIYSKINTPISRAMVNGTTDGQQIFDYLEVLDEAQFLFGEDVLRFIEQYRILLIEHAEATTMLKDEGRHLSPDERDRYVKKHSKLMYELGDFRSRLIELLKPYMLMELKRPWSFEPLMKYLRNYFWH